MGFMFFIFGLLVFITLFLPWINSSRIKSLRGEIDYLQGKIQDLNNKLLHLEHGKTLTETVQEKQYTAEPITEPAQEDIKEPAEEFELWDDEEALPKRSVENKTPRISLSQGQENIKSTLEQNLATKAPVWIGALSLICAAFFMVKYSIEAGLLGPAVRVTLGGLFGTGLLYAGRMVLNRAQKIANAQRIAQGLIGAGLVSLYGTLYAATNLHDLIPLIIGFSGMVIVTGIAIIASLRHGQPIAVFGIIGGLMTPALIGSNDPDLISFLVYLFVLFTGIFMVLIRQGWWKLAILSLVGSLGWSFLWIATNLTPSDAPILILFAMALTTVILSVTGRRIAKSTVTKEERLPLHTLNGLAIAGGLGTIVWLGLDLTMGLFEWSMIGLLSVALMTLAYFDPETYEKPLLVKIGAVFAVLLFWVQDQTLTNALPVITGCAVLYVGGTGLIMRKVKDPRFWAITQTISTLTLYLISFFALDMPHEVNWGLLCLGIAGLAIFQASDLRKKYQANTQIQDHLVAIYALTASAFISIGLTTELPWAYAPLAIAGQILATAWVYQKTSIEALQKIILLLILVFVGMNYEQILLFLGMGISSLFDDTLSAREINMFILDKPLIQLGGSSLLIYLAYWLTPRHETFLNERLVKTLFATATALAMALAYYMFRTVIHDGTGTIFEETLGFIERGILTTGIAVAGTGVLYIANNKAIPSLTKWGHGIFALAMFRLVYFDMVLYNPYFSSSQFVGDMVLFNGVTLTYGLGTVFATWMAYKSPKMQKIYGGVALASLFAFASFTVRQYFHDGTLTKGAVSSPELYSYSAMWLIVGIGLLASGIRFESKTLRMASLAFMLLTVCKVFLIDASELEGLLRVISFLGLGVSLIGLSAFYTKFVFAKETANKKA